MKLEPIFSFPERVPKGWGEEIHIANNESYCGKLLVFKSGAEFSTHAHALKHETFLVFKGSIRFTWINTENADKESRVVTEGMVIEIPRLLPHRIKALEDSIIIEVSTQHLDSDSLRYEKGDSQK